MFELLHVFVFNNSVLRSCLCKKVILFISNVFHVIPLSTSQFLIWIIVLPLIVSHAPKKYAFTDPTLTRQIKKFEALCCKIHDAEEILGNASVGVDVGTHHVKVPYKLLLTRLSSSLDLIMNGQTVSITFRIEPVQDPQVASALKHIS